MLPSAGSKYSNIIIFFAERSLVYVNWNHNYHHHFHHESDEQFTRTIPDSGQIHEQIHEPVDSQYRMQAVQVTLHVYV